MPMPAINDFSVHELELLCKADYVGTSLRAQKARQFKRHAAKHLAQLFQSGSADAAQDLHKSRQYAAMAGIKEPTEINNPLLNTNTFYNLHIRLITHPRVFWVRLNRLLSTIKRSYQIPFVNLFSLSYVISFLFDVGVVLKTTFKDPSPQEGFYWRRAYIRFKNVLTKDKRPHRMLNDLVWAIVNVLTFNTVGAALNLMGFTFDVFHEVYWLWRDRREHNALIAKLNRHPALRDGITQEHYRVLRRRGRVTICTLLVLIGTGLFFFPPALIPYAAVIGCALSLVAGNLFTGLGWMIYDHYIPNIRQWIANRYKNKPAPTINPLTPTAPSVNNYRKWLDDLRIEKTHAIVSPWPSPSPSACSPRVMLIALHLRHPPFPSAPAIENYNKWLENLPGKKHAAASFQLLRLISPQPVEGRRSTLLDLETAALKLKARRNSTPTPTLTPIESQPVQAATPSALSTPSTSSSAPSRPRSTSLQENSSSIQPETAQKRRGSTPSLSSPLPPKPKHPPVAPPARPRSTSLPLLPLPQQLMKTGYDPGVFAPGNSPRYPNNFIKLTPGHTAQT